MQGMSSHLAKSLADRLPTIAQDRYVQAIAYIKSEAALVATFAPILPLLCVAEVESQSSALDAVPLLESWPSTVAEFDRWKLDAHAPSSESGRFHR